MRASAGATVIEKLATISLTSINVMNESPLINPLQPIEEGAEGGGLLALRTHVQACGVTTGISHRPSREIVSVRIRV